MVVVKDIIGLFNIVVYGVMFYFYIKGWWYFYVVLVLDEMGRKGIEFDVVGYGILILVCGELDDKLFVFLVRVMVNS